MDRALAAVAAAALAAPTPKPQTAMLWRSSLAFAAYRRGDNHEALRQHEAELAMAESLGWLKNAEVAESNVFSASMCPASCRAWHGSWSPTGAWSMARACSAMPGRLTPRVG
jgi:hypothetical protein